MCEWKDESTNERWVKINEHTTTVNIRMKHLNFCVMLLLTIKRKRGKEEDWTFKRKKTDGCGLFSV